LVRNFSGLRLGLSKGMTLQRLNNEKGYSPENCAWRTRKLQARNKRSSHIVHEREFNIELANLYDLLKDKVRDKRAFRRYVISLCRKYLHGGELPEETNLIEPKPLD
jgi:hypothetical protein